MAATDRAGVAVPLADGAAATLAALRMAQSALYAVFYRATATRPPP